MRLKINFAFALSLSLAAVSATLAGAQAPTAPEKPLRAELALGYTFVHSNAPPGSCTCFNMNGGNATFAWPVKPGHFAAVGDVAVAHAGSVGSGGYTLTMTTITGGARYLPRVGHGPLQPFGQALVGLAHSSGTLVQGSNPAAANAGAAFAANLGGGLDLRVSRRLAVRLIEADYLLTRFDNGVNDHQNNLRLSAGIVIRF
jgi:peptidoglycan-associated lipoprotein